MASANSASKILRTASSSPLRSANAFGTTAKRRNVGIPHPSSHAVRPSEEAKTFEAPSRPRAVYARPKLKPARELPIIRNRMPLVIVLAAVALSTWGGFLLYTANQERLASSVVRQFILKTKRSQNSELREALGDDIQLEPEWWMLSQPWVNGQVSVPKGQVDVSIKVKGSKGAGVLYFTSVRREPGAPFSIVRFKVITDDGRTIHLDPSEDPEGTKSAK